MAAGILWEAVRKSLVALWRTTPGFTTPGGDGVPVFDMLPPSSEPFTDFVVVGADPAGEDEGGSFNRVRTTVGLPARRQEVGQINAWVAVQAGDSDSAIVRDAALLRVDALTAAVDTAPFLDGTVAELIETEVQAGSVRVWQDEYGTAAEVRITVAYITNTGV